MQEMTYHIGDGWGESVDNPSVEEMQQFLDKLDIDDEEHCEVWLTNDLTGWTLSCFPSNTIVFYDSSEDGDYSPRHLTNVFRNKMLELWEKLAKSQNDELEKELWEAGHTSEPPPPPIDPKDLHRDFWNQLNSAKRRPNLVCGGVECKETPIELSVLCPKHHFEKTIKIQCPFD